MNRTGMTPLGALFRGLVAGAIGSAAQTLFFAATKKITPSSQPASFQPPEPEQKDEQVTETAARRIVEGLMQRELPAEKKAKAGQAVHYAFGAGWGALYGLSAASVPAIGTPLGGLGFGVVVWAIGDELLLPALKLAGWPQEYPAKIHAYAIAAHLAYGAAMWLAFDRMRPHRREARTERALSEKTRPVEPSPGEAPYVPIVAPVA